MSQSKFGNIPGCTKPVSRLIQGTTMARNESAYPLFDAALENGINTFDTAQVYGNEGVLGGWIAARNNHDKVNILTKGAHHNADGRRVTPKDIDTDVEGSLQKLGVEHIDIYILHRDDPSVPVGPIVEVLNKHQKAGNIGAFGGSNWTHTRIKEANEYAAANGLVPFAISNPNFSVVDMVEEPWSECVSIAGTQGREAREWYAAQKDLVLFTWSTLAGGFLSGRVTRENKDSDEWNSGLVKRCYFSDDNFTRLDRVREIGAKKGLSVPQVALAYVLSQPGNIHTLIAPVTPDEIAQNVAALDVTLTADEIAYLELR
ncbi:MAG TPA: aldo/keto reductase [Capsulimonadaceae bacterium]|jgi:aryl-alcohol dehydrogenase-like predicted oxidoreductase